MEVRERLDDGRYGPVFLAQDRETDALVIVRTFDEELDLAQRAILLDALQRACEAPLQHASIGRPLACGLDNDRIYVVHTRLPGEPAEAWLRRHGPASLAELLVPLASASAAIDFAAAVGVHHGALTTADLIIDGQSAGVTGWGIEQARAAAGLTQASPSHAGDIAALAWVVQRLVDPADAAWAQRVFDRARLTDPDEQFHTALEFAAALQQVVSPAPPVDALDQFADVQESPTDATALADFAAIDEPFDAPLHVEPGAGSAAKNSAYVPVEYGERVPPPVENAPSVPQTQAYVPAPVFAPYDPPPRRFFPIVAVALLMLAVGFAGGWVVGRQQNDATVAVSPAPLTTASTAGTLNDVPLVEPPVVPSDTDTKPRPAAPADSAPQAPVQAQTPAPRPAQQAGGSRQAPHPADAEAVLQVDSRPRGAQVYLDGRLIGRTPAVAGGVKPGRHMVQLRLTGHREWATDVTVAAGEHARIGGSLEEIY